MKKETLIICLGFFLIMGGCIGYSALTLHYPGNGFTNVIANALKEPIPFDQAIQALKDGHRIRRKQQYTGYSKLVILEGTRQSEKFVTYFVRENKTWDHCSFTIDDVLATDWIIDDDMSSEG